MNLQIVQQAFFMHASIMKMCWTFTNTSWYMIFQEALDAYCGPKHWKQAGPYCDIHPHLVIGIYLCEVKCIFSVNFFLILQDSGHCTSESKQGFGMHSAKEEKIKKKKKKKENKKEKERWAAFWRTRQNSLEMQGLCYHRRLLLTPCLVIHWNR